MLAGTDRLTTLVWRSRSPRSNPARVAMSTVAIKAPFEGHFIEAAAECLGAVCVAAEAYVGEAISSIGAGALLGLVPKNSAQSQPPPPFGLPALRGRGDLPSPIYPVFLEWLNYWPPATCRLLGFPDPARDADLLTRSRELPNGAWLVCLTDDPLDPAARPDHVRALHAGYARFPQIGGRDTPPIPVRT
jgi:hypothetical protein